MLKAENICKTFLKGGANERNALNNLSLELGDGEFAVIIGGNGSGKSTLLNVIAGTCESDSGNILLDDKNVNRLPEHKRAKYIGRVFQDPLRGTAPSMTIAENLSMAYRRGKKHRLARGIRKENLELFHENLRQLNLGLENRMHSQVGLLSGGQRQALTLLMATIAQPGLLLLDEHTAALDPATAKKVLDITADVIARQRLSALMVTHNMRDALTYGSRTIMMDNGRIIFDVSGARRRNMKVDDLIELFHKNSGRDYENDKFLLA